MPQRYFLHAGSDNQIVATCVKLFDTMAQMTGRQLNWADPLGEYVGRGSHGVANDRGGKKASKVLSFRRSRRSKSRLELPRKKLLLVYNADATGAAAARALQVSIEIANLPLPLTHPSALALIHEPNSTFATKVQLEVAMNSFHNRAMKRLAAEMMRKADSKTRKKLQAAEEAKKNRMRRFARRGRDADSVGAPAEASAVGSTPRGTPRSTPRRGEPGFEGEDEEGWEVVLASDDVELATSEVEEADIVVLLQTGGVLEKASVLIRMYEADTSDKPIMCILVPGGGYDFAMVKNHLLELKKELRSEELKEVVRHMRERGEPAGKLGIWLSRSIPLIISVAIPINGTDNEIEASTMDFSDRLARVRINKQAGFSTKLDAEGVKAMHKMARDISLAKDNFQLLIKQTQKQAASRSRPSALDHAVEMVAHETDAVVHAVESAGHAVEVAAHETASAAHAAAVQLQARWRGIGLRSAAKPSDSPSAPLHGCSSAAGFQVAPSDAASPVSVEITTTRVESPRPGLRKSFTSGASKKEARPPPLMMPPGQSTKGKEPVSEEHV